MTVSQLLSRGTKKPMEKTLIVTEINKTISTQLNDKATVISLLNTTFKGLSEQTMKQAMCEGMMRGFTFQDFLNKDVYALPFKSGYSLITSIDYMRKIAAQNGLAGKNAPVYEDDANGRPKTCSVTVKRMVNGILAEYTALVYLSEYTTNQNQWAARPRTMLAKVAEMHALRMAFPEELAKSYIEEEQTPTQNATVEVVIDYVGIQAQFDACDTIEAVREVFSKLPQEAKADGEVVAMGKARKEALSVPVSQGAVIDDDIPVITGTPTK